jgi:hypothetical protein
MISQQVGNMKDLLIASAKTSSGSGSGSPSDSQFNSVTTLIHGNGANGTTNNSFIANGLSLSKTGSVTEGTFTPYGSNWSILTGGANACNTANSANFGFSTGDFTVECWINQSTTNANNGTILDFRSSNTAQGFALQINGSSNGLQGWDGAAGGVNHTDSSAIVNGQWYHVALTRASGVWRLFKNGVQVTTWTGADNLGSTQPVYIGTNVAGSTYSFYGYISNLRIINGTAIYTANFTPSSSPLTAVAGTVLLTAQNNRFIDNSTYSQSLTLAGYPQITRLNPFGDNKTPYSTSTYGGSCWFDGSTGYLSSTNTTLLSNLAFGTNSFTVEAWVYPINGATVWITETRNSSHTNGWVFFASGDGLGLDYNSTSIVSVSTGVASNAWSHVAYSRSGTTGRLFVNGSLVASVSDTNSYTATDMYIANAYNLSSFSNCYITDLRITNGNALYTSSFTPPMIPLTAGTNTVFLYNANNAGGSGIYDNAMQQNIITLGTAQVSTTKSKFSSGSLYFDGSTGCVEIPNNQLPIWGSANWTIECWLNPTTTSGYGFFIQQRPNTSAIGPFSFYILSGGLALVASTNGSSWTTNLSGGTGNSIPTNTWSHVAAVRNGGTITLYLNGNAVNSGTCSGALMTTTNAILIGSALTSGYNYTGYMQDVRISYGVARYISNFTVPATSFLNQ